MPKFPSETIPGEYNREVFQRLMEDVYRNFEKTNKNILDAAIDANEKIEALSSSTGEAGSGAAGINIAPVPTPTGVRVFKIYNLVASVRSD